mmetsp:Transcript_117599/g.337374  ORF Transcript_117599/g.337374 Transcript_117599/m.337374 type:complete len:148 (-) Transcript_117599:152-595(-)
MALDLQTRAAPPELTSDIAGRPSRMCRSSTSHFSAAAAGAKRATSLVRAVQGSPLGLLPAAMCTWSLPNPGLERGDRSNVGAWPEAKSDLGELAALVIASASSTSFFGDFFDGVKCGSRPRLTGDAETSFGVIDGALVVRGCACEDQ